MPEFIGCLFENSLFLYCSDDRILSAFATETFHPPDSREDFVLGSRCGLAGGLCGRGTSRSQLQTSLSFVHRLREGASFVPRNLIQPLLSKEAQKEGNSEKKDSLALLRD